MRSLIFNRQAQASKAGGRLNKRNKSLSNSLLWKRYKLRLKAQLRKFGDNGQPIKARKTSG
jgi:hypothetical protein